METRQKLTLKGERDYLLITRIREEDDQKAFEALYNHYQKSVYYMMYKMTNNPVEAEDLMIEAFEKAFRNLDNYISDYTFSTWLFKIAANNCIDHMRKKINKLNSLPIDGLMNQGGLSDQFISENHNPEEKLIKKQRGELINKLIKKVNPHFRKVIELRYLKEYSIEEISTALKLPIGTVKGKLFRGREHLYSMAKDMEML
jgi:RNA polymerase sigma factor (sigma-70 family)